jgi:hypothetical protein
VSWLRGLNLLSQRQSQGSNAFYHQQHFYC